jgi:hypothetical protein
LGFAKNICPKTSVMSRKVNNFFSIFGIIHNHR